MSFPKPPITVHRLLFMFVYDKERGLLFWKNPPKFHSQLKGKKAGAVQRRNHTDYWFIKIDGIPRSLHRLIWCIETGSYPKGEIDHVDGNGLNNRFTNLRDVSSRANHQNRQIHRKGRLIGFTFCKRNKKFRAQISVNGTSHNLGYFKSEEEAHKRYVAELERLDL